MSSSFEAKRQKYTQYGAMPYLCLKIGLCLFFCAWSLIMFYHLFQDKPPSPPQGLRAEMKPSNDKPVLDPMNVVVSEERSVSFEDTDESYHLVFSTGCSEFQDWQSIGIFSSAQAVGQRGIITRIASGCTSQQEDSLRHAMSHLPKNYRIHFAPNTDVKDHAGRFYKYANKPLGMMHWLMHSDPKVVYVQFQYITYIFTAFA